MSARSILANHSSPWLSQAEYVGGKMPMPHGILGAKRIDSRDLVWRERRGVTRTDFGGLGLMVDYTLDETPRRDILLVSGTPYPHTVMGDQQVLEWIAQVHKTTKWTTSVCIGALGLADAGVLQASRPLRIGSRSTLEAIWCDSDERTSRPSRQSVHRSRRVLENRHGAHRSCRRVRVSLSAMRPTPHRVRPAAPIRYWQSRKCAVADCA
jgi:putative intracellular protease/amidase